MDHNVPQAQGSAPAAPTNARKRRTANRNRSRKLAKAYAKMGASGESVTCQVSPTTSPAPSTPTSTASPVSPVTTGTDSPTSTPTTPSKPPSPLRATAPKFEPSFDFKHIHEENAKCLHEFISKSADPEVVEECCVHFLLKGDPVPGNVVVLRGRAMVVGEDLRLRDLLIHYDFD